MKISRILKTAALVYDFLAYLWVLARLPELAAADETAIRFTPAASRLPRAVGPATPPVHRAVIAVR